jgi:hypothetical protein
MLYSPSDSQEHHHNYCWASLMGTTKQKSSFGLQLDKRQLVSFVYVVMMGL